MSMNLRSLTKIYPEAKLINKNVLNPKLQSSYYCITTEFNTINMLNVLFAHPVVGYRVFWLKVNKF